MLRTVRVSVNSLMRRARSLFSPKILRQPLSPHDGDADFDAVLHDLALFNIRRWQIERVSLGILEDLRASAGDKVSSGSPPLEFRGWRKSRT